MKRYKVAWQAYHNNPNSKGGQVLGPTRGQAVPRNRRQGCLCLDTDTYSRECCKGLLINQGIGQTQSSPIRTFGSFNTDFNNDFDIFQ